MEFIMRQKGHEPARYLSGTPTRVFKDDRRMGMDEFARSAMETYRSSYNPLPTCNVREFATFFSRRNYENLFKEVRRRAGNEPDGEELWESMMYAYSMTLPRSDEMDQRRTKFDDATVMSYVHEMNQIVLEKAVPDVVAANQLWEHLAKYRHGPRDMGEDPDLHFGVDTRTRLRASEYDGTYLMA